MLSERENFSCQQKNTWLIYLKVHFLRVKIQNRIQDHQQPINSINRFLFDSFQQNSTQLPPPFACVGEKNEFRLAEGLNCMAMYAMGVESCAEVLAYLNRALDICNHNGVVNG